MTGRQQRSGERTEDTGTDDVAGTPLPPWVVVRAVLAIVLAGFFVVGLSDQIATPGSGFDTAVTLIVLGVLAVIQIAYFARPLARLDHRTSLALLAVQAVLTFGMHIVYGNQWAALPGLLAGSALLVLPARWRWAAFVLVIALDVPRYGGGLSAESATEASVSPVIVVYTAIGAAITGLVVFGLCRLAGLVADLGDSRQELVRAAAERERLNLSIDLDQTIGRRLAEIILRGEVAQRGAGLRSGRVADEIGQILLAARHALTEARAIASRYRALSLEQELRSAGQVLEIAGIRVTSPAEVPELPVEVGTALAVAVREGVTELMRSRDVRACTISLRTTGDVVRLEITDTRPDPDPDPGPDPSALPVARARVTRLGGQVDVWCSPGTPFRMAVHVPTVPALERPVSSGTARLAAALRSGAVSDTWSAEVLAGAVLVGFLLVAALRAVPAVPGAVQGTVTIAGLVLITVVQIAVLRSRRPEDDTVRRVAWAAQALLLVLPLLVGVSTWVSLPGVVAGAAFLTWRPRTAWAPALLVLGGAVLVQAQLGASSFEVVFTAVSMVNSAVTTWALVRLAWLVRSVHAAQHQFTDFAVLTERLRVIRDVHDLLGLNLSAIALKGELASRLIGRDQAAAESELTDIVAIARAATVDLAAVTQGSPSASLQSELEAIRAILRTTDVELTEHVEALDLHPEHIEVCVAVLREGVTNMLRHSKVEACRIELANSPAGEVLVEIVNDGAADPAAASRDVTPRPSAAPGGRGLQNLRERVAAIGGTLDAERTDGSFHLRARLPEAA